MTRLITHMALFTALLSMSSIAHAAEPEAAAEAPLKAAIELGAPFCDHMILQRDMKVPVWGWSKPGDTITVEFAGQKKTATAAEDGSSTGSGQARWMVQLDPLKASAEPAEMVITDSSGRQEVRSWAITRRRSSFPCCSNFSTLSAIYPCRFIPMTGRRVVCSPPIMAKRRPGSSCMPSLAVASMRD